MKRRAMLLAMALVAASSAMAGVQSVGAATGTGELTLLSTSSSNVKADFGASGILSVSADGSVVVFGSQLSTNLVSSTPTVKNQVYAKNVLTGITTLVSASETGVPGNGSRTEEARVSSNGRFVAFASNSSNLTPLDTDSDWDVFVKDLSDGSIALATTDPSGVKSHATFTSGPPRVSDDGATVVFASDGPLLPAHQANIIGFFNEAVYSKNLDTGAVTLLSDPRFGGATTGGLSIDMTADGQWVALSTFQQLSAADTDDDSDIYVIDTATGTDVTLVSEPPGGDTDRAAAIAPSIADDVRRVTYQGFHRGLTNSTQTQIWMKDGDDPARPLIQVTAGANGSSQVPEISPDGGYVVYASDGTNLVPGDTNGYSDVFLENLDTGEVTLISQTDDGVQTDNSTFFGVPTSLGESVFFQTFASNLSPLDTDTFTDIYRKILPADFVDEDSDGIDDSLQPAGTAFYFEDDNDPPTSGQITNANGLAITITDAPDALDGVVITTGDGPSGIKASFMVCGPYTLRLEPNTSITLTCGSVKIEVGAGTAEIETPGDSPVVGVATDGATLYVDQLGNGDRYVFQKLGSTGDVVVTSGSTETVLSEDQEFTVDANLPPEVVSVDVPVEPVALGESVQVIATFTDAAEDTHTCSVMWGDSTQSSGAVSAQTCTASHIYSDPGVYNVEVSVADDDGGVASATAGAYVVVYDPSAGFVTGGGWFESPLGAYTADPSLTGRANFGFNAKYRRGANTPDGSTTFQFQTAELRFKSTSYDWLVVAGKDRAKYKGSGQLNGVDGYGFMLTAVDAASGDTLRMKVWETATGDVVYDNHQGDDASYAGTTLGGGSIVVHTR